MRQQGTHEQWRREPGYSSPESLVRIQTHGWCCTPVNVFAQMLRPSDEEGIDLLDL